MVYQKGRIPENKTHGMSKTSFYKRWKDARSRCNNKNNSEYHNYGGRGISVCSRWNRFENFQKDMFESFSPELSLDRINNDGNYCKENCRWSTPSEQTNNQRKSVKFAYNGEPLSLREISSLSGIGYHALKARLTRFGWSVEDATSIPTKKGNNGSIRKKNII